MDNIVTNSIVMNSKDINSEAKSEVINKKE